MGRHVQSIIGGQCMYVARDKDGSIFMYTTKPKKGGEMWRGAGWMQITDCVLPKSINPQWNDLEPIKVKLIRDNKED